MEVVTPHKSASQAEDKARQGKARHYSEQAFTHHEQAVHRSNQTVQVGRDTFRRIYKAASQVYNLGETLESTQTALVAHQARDAESGPENKYGAMQELAANQKERVLRLES